SRYPDRNFTEKRSSSGICHHIIFILIFKLRRGVEDNMIVLRNKELAFSILVILVLTIPTLAAYGQNEKVHVVILFKEKLSDKNINLLILDGEEIKRYYHIINGISVDIEQDKINSLKNDPSVISVDPDLEVKALDINADTQIGANEVWISATGQGIPVAILDTGIDTTHPEFAGRIALCHSKITNKIGRASCRERV